MELSYQRIPRRFCFLYLFELRQRIFQVIEILAHAVHGIFVQAACDRIHSFPFKGKIHVVDCVNFLVHLFGSAVIGLHRFSLPIDEAASPRIIGARRIGEITDGIGSESHIYPELITEIVLI